MNFVNVPYNNVADLIENNNQLFKTVKNKVS